MKMKKMNNPKIIYCNILMMIIVVVLCILFISLIIHQRFFTIIEGKKGKKIGKGLKKVGSDIKKGANKAVDAVEDTAKDVAKDVGKGFKALLNVKFIKFARQLFTKEFLKKE
jgi:hypothetical protein